MCLGSDILPSANSVAPRGRSTRKSRGDNPRGNEGISGLLARREGGATTVGAWAFWYPGRKSPRRWGEFLGAMDMVARLLLCSNIPPSLGVGLGVWVQVWPTVEDKRHVPPRPGPASGAGRSSPDRAMKES